MTATANGDLPASLTQLAYDRIRRQSRRLGCDVDEHIAFTTTDRAGVWFWACRLCPALREQGDPTWRRT